MRVALAQLGSNPGDFPAIVDKMLRVSDRARDLGADLIVFPASLLCGVYPIGLASSEAFEMDMLDAIESYAARTDVPSIIPAYVNDGFSGYADVFLCEGGVAGPLRMREVHHAKDDSLLPEDMPACIRVGDVDVLIVTGPGETDVEDADPDLTIICPTLPFCVDDSTSLLAFGLADGTLRSVVDAMPNWVACLQGVGGYDDAVLAGGSFAVSPDGVIVAACPSFEEALVTFDVEHCPDEQDGQEGGEADDEANGSSIGRGENPKSHKRGLFKGADVLATSPLSLSVRSSGTQSAQDMQGMQGAQGAGVTDGTPGAGGAQGVDSLQEAEGTGSAQCARGLSEFVGKSMDGIASLTPSDELEFVWRALEVALRDFVDKTGASRVAVGIAGDLGSSVIATLAADALGADRVLGVLVPASDNERSTVAIPLQALQQQGIESVVAPLPQTDPSLANLLDADALVSRLRGAVLESIAQERGALVLSSGDKTVSGLGMVLAFADAARTYRPLVDVYHSEVADLAIWRMSHGGSDEAPTENSTPAILALALAKSELGMGSLSSDASELFDGLPSRASSSDAIAVRFPDQGEAPGSAPRFVSAAGEEALRGIVLPVSDVDSILYMNVERSMEAADISDASNIAIEKVVRVLDTCRDAELLRRREPMGPVISLVPFIDRGWPVALGWRRSLGAGSPVSYQKDDVAQELGRAFRVQLGEETQTDAAARGGYNGSDDGGDEVEQEDDMPAEENPVASRLDDMVSRISHQDQIIGMISDVAFGAQLSGQGSDMDTVMGVPLFSKN